MSSNYSEEETDYMISEYQSNPCRDTVEEIASKLNRSTKSVIGKLSREGVYRRETYVTKAGETPITKSEIVASIADALGLEVERLDGLEKAPKGVLKVVAKAVAGLEELQDPFVTKQLEMEKAKSKFS